VQALEMLGAERLVYGTVGDTLFTARLDATDAYPAIGDVVDIAVSPEHMHWFDAETSARVNR
jgi:sn-glycerol 3-phosphate transport system ATP-binding protein